MDRTQVKQELSRLPLPVIAGAHAAFVPVFEGDQPLTKGLAIEQLANAIMAGVTTLDKVMNSKPQGGFASKSTDPRLDAVSGVANQAHAASLDSLNRIKTIEGAVSKVVEVAKRQQASLDRLAEKVDTFKVDDARINAEVAKVVADAFKPFRTAVENAGAQTVVADLSSVFAVDNLPAHEVFGLLDPITDHAGNMVFVQVWNHPAAPAVDPGFVWTETILRHLILSSKTGDHLWFGGEKGTGKSETARQFAARTGRAFKRINFHKHTSAEEYLGATGLENGATVFQPRDFLTAYTTPSTVILLDEVTNADPGELAPLNGFLEPNAAVSFGGQRWTKAPGVFVIAADNTFGSGDESGRHAGTRQQNSALVDRFARVIPFTFLPVDQEIEAITNRTGCTNFIAAHVLGAITTARGKVDQGEIVDAPSIRSAIAFIRSLGVISPKDAWQTAIVSRQPSESHAALWAVYEAQINEQALIDNL